MLLTPEQRSGRGHFFLQHGQSGQGLDSGGGQARIARGQGEGQRIEEQVVGTASPRRTARSWSRCSTTAFLSRSRAIPSSSMARQTTAAPKSRGQGEDRFGAGAAVLEVDGIDHRPAGAALQPRLQRGDAGAVQHQRQAVAAFSRRSGPLHVAGFVAAGVGHVEVEQVGPFARLLLGDGQHGVQVVGQQRRLELAAAAWRWSARR